MAAFAYGLDPTRPIPPSLRLGLRCRRWGTLPAGGGFEDQCIRTMLEIEESLAINDLFDSLNASESLSVWHTKNPEYFKVYAGLLAKIDKMKELGVYHLL